MSVPPLDFLEFRARLPLATPQGVRLLKDFTLEETMVALALWHVQRAPYSREAIAGNATVQPNDVMFVAEHLLEWEQTFKDARKHLVQVRTDV